MAKQVIDDKERDLLWKVDEAIIRAGEIMDLADLDPEMDESERESIFEARFHCGKCIVTNVMETIWDDLNNLMEYYSDRTPEKP